MVALKPHDMLFAAPNAMHIMTYPKILLAIWIVASILYLIGPKDDNYWFNLKKAKLQLIKVFCSIAVYIFAFKYLGLLLGTLLFLLIFFLIMGYKNKFTIPVSVSLALLTWFSFEKLLGIPMPRPFFLDVL